MSPTDINIKDYITNFNEIGVHIQKIREYFNFLWLFLRLQIHNIVTSWLITLIVSWTCVYSREPMEDSGFGLHWCLTTMVLLVPFGSEIEMCNIGCLHIQTWLQCSLICAGCSASSWWLWVTRHQVDVCTSAATILAPLLYGVDHVSPWRD